MFSMNDLGHTGDLYISLVIRCLVVKIKHLQVTVDVVTLKKAMQTTALNNRVYLLSKFTYTNLYTKGPFSELWFES